MASLAEKTGSPESVMPHYWLRHLLAIALAAALLAPSVPWITDAWQNSPLDSPGQWFALLALSWWMAVAWLVSPTGNALYWEGASFDLLSLVTVGVGVYFDVHVLLAAGSLGLAWSLSRFLVGGSAWVLLLPALLLALLALPTTAYVLQQAWPFDWPVTNRGMVLKTVLATIILGTGGWVLFAQVHHRCLRLGFADSAYVTLALVASVSLAMAFRPPEFGPGARMDTSQWAFDRWIGAEIDATPAEQRLYDQARLSKRVYAGPQGQRVALLIVETDDVHDLHAPEYCLTGGGWQTEHRGTAAFPVGPGGARVSSIGVRRGEDRLQSVYWFSSSARSTTDLVGLRLQNRIDPNERFTLYLVSALDNDPDTSQIALREFLGAAPWL